MLPAAHYLRGHRAVPVDSPRCGRRTAVCGVWSSGIVDLKQGLRIPPFETQAYTVTSPPVVANGSAWWLGPRSATTVGRIPQAARSARSMHGRARVRWSWDPIPQDPADPAYGEWRGTLAHGTGAANAWSALSADPQRDLVFIPTSSPAPDYYGVLRLGDNRYANSIVALRLSTGERVWTFQTVHHDLWDYDNACSAGIGDAHAQGAEIPAVLQATKTGMLFVLNRKPASRFFRSRNVRSQKRHSGRRGGSDAALHRTDPAAQSASAQARGRMGHQRCGPARMPRDARGLRNEGIFTPPSVQGTLVLPSNIGGAHWGGVAVDPVRQIAVVPVNRVAAMVQLIPRADFDRDRFRAEDARLGQDYEYNMMLGTPYVMRRRILLGPSGLPCSPPPGARSSRSISRRAHLWETPLGSFTRPLGPEMALEIREEWGSPNLGGPIATAGGVVFIGAALDRWLRAYDIETGRELWRGPLPESGRATPMSYQLRSGEQFVVIAVGGGDVWEAGDHLVAFRLPSAR